MTARTTDQVIEEIESGEEILEHIKAGTEELVLRFPVEARHPSIVSLFAAMTAMTVAEEALDVLGESDPDLTALAEKVIQGILDHINRRRQH